MRRLSSREKEELKKRLDDYIIQNPGITQKELDRVGWNLYRKQAMEVDIVKKMKTEWGPTAAQIATVIQDKVPPEFESPIEETLFYWMMDSSLADRFEYQYKIHPFRADFAFLKERLVVECDGSYHDDPEQQAKDARRDSIMRSRGWHVLRLSGIDIYHDTRRCIESIEEKLREIHE